MSKRHKVVSAIAVQEKKTALSGTVATRPVQKRKRQTHNEIRNEGYENGVRNCAEAMLNDGNSRDYVAEVLTFASIPFPSTDDTIWVEFLENSSKFPKIFSR